jgi:hypothetical protein
MTGIEIAGGFATIVALIGQFKQERKDEKDSEKDERARFIEWLEYHRHHQIKNLIETNAAVQAEIGSLLQQDTRAILDKLEHLADVVARIASGIDEFRGLVTAITPGNDVHAETMALLPELVKKDWQRFQLTRDAAGPELWTIEGKCEPIEIDPQFVEQDLDRLVELGFLESGYMERGKKYTLTRSAYKFVRAIQG